METANITEKIVEQDSDYQLIAQANEEFNNRNYEKCLEMLEKIELTSGISSELLHNRAIAKFYKSECKDHANLLKELNELDANELTDSPKSSSSLVMPTSSLNPIALYNKAVIYFHRHMHRTAIETLQPLVDKLDTLMEHIATLVGTLMLTLLLVTNQLNKALAFLDVLQIQIGLSTDNTLTVDDSAAKNLSSVAAFNRNFKLLAMLTNVLNRKVVVIPDDGTPEFSALKAHQYYIMKDFQMAAKQLKKISTEHYMESALSDELNTCIANNMGVIHLRVRHYAIAAKFFQNAITFDKKIAANLRNAPLQNMSNARSCEILYNLGIAMLHLRRPKEAFQALLVPLKTYHSNPRLWFRIAEACIMDHEIKNLEDNKKPVLIGANVGAQRNSATWKPVQRIMYSPSNQSAAMPEPTLEFAALSLRNALSLTKYYRKTFYIPPNDGAESETQSWHKVKDNNFCNPSNSISKEAVDNMLSAIYAAYSYVSLRLGDYVSALEMAQELLKAEKLSDAHKLLAHMYAGEALIMMDKVAEARPHLDPTFVGTLNAFDFETRDWQVKSLDAAQNIVHYNLAVAMALQGDYKTSMNLLGSCTHPIVANKTLTLKMYLASRCT